MDDLLEAGDEEEAGAHDDLGHGEEGVDLMVLHALPHLGQPVTETVGDQDTSANIEEEGEDDVLQLPLLSLHHERITGVYCGEIISTNIKLVYLSDL